MLSAVAVCLNVYLVSEDGRKIGIGYLLPPIYFSFTRPPSAAAAVLLSIFYILFFLSLSRNESLFWANKYCCKQVHVHSIFAYNPGGFHA